MRTQEELNAAANTLQKAIDGHETSGCEDPRCEKMMKSLKQAVTVIHWASGQDNEFIDLLREMKGYVEDDLGDQMAINE